MKKWNDILDSAHELVTFLEKDVFFDKPFISTIDSLVVKDAKLGYKYANYQETDLPFPEWENFAMGEDVFPSNFDFSDVVFYELGKLNYFNIEQKDFSGIDELWEYSIADMMLGDIRYIFYCYANDYFPPVWEQILTAYLNDGLPCGWSDFPPNGKLVVYSNELLEP